jgi:hypothetical protein
MPVPMILLGIAALCLGLAFLAMAGVNHRQVRRLLGALLRQGLPPPVRGSPAQRHFFYPSRPSRAQQIGYRQ